MDFSAMDDKLYYVESPDQKVLGPMNMIHILEGIAAGAILDSARICEVGRQEWVDLSEIAYTHEEEETPGQQVPAPDSPATSASDRPTVEIPSPVPHPPAPPAEPPLNPVDAMPADTGVPVDDDPLDVEVDVHGAESPLSLVDAMPAGTGQYDPFDLESDNLEAVLGTGLEAEHKALENAIPTPVEAVPDPIETAPDEPELPASAFPEETPPELPASAFPEETPHELPASALPEETQHELPAAAFPEDTPYELPASAFPADGPGAGADDFALQMPSVDEELEEAVEAEAEAPRRRKWVAPVAIAVAIPLLAGIYVIAGGPVPFTSEPDSAAGDGAVAPAPGNDSPTTADQAWSALSDGKPRRALRYFDAALAEDATDPRTHHGRGLAALRSGDSEEAIRSLEHSLELDATNSLVRTDLGRALLESGAPGLAVTCAQQVLDLDPTWAAARRLLGQSLLAAGDSEAAVVTLTEHLQTRPDDLAARLDLANAFAGTGRLEPALEEIQAYLAAHPEDRESDARRLEWLRATGRITKTKLLYNTLATERPGDAHVHYLAGLAHSESEEGIAYLERSLEIDPSDPEVIAVIAEYRKRLGRQASAKAEARQAATENRKPAGVETAQATPKPTPKPPAPAPVPSASLGNRFGEIREAVIAGSFGEAREALEKAQAEYPGDADAQRNLALWTAILDFHEGHLDDAHAAFAKLDPAEDYSAAGFGPGVVHNWQAKSNLAKGDVRAAIAALDGVGRADADEYATARLWEGMALAALGMGDLAERTWQNVPGDVGASTSGVGEGAVKSAEFLAGEISVKEYRTAVGTIVGFENDMHFVLGFHARRSDEPDVARAHFRRVLEASNGHDFPYDLAQAEVDGTGLTGEWPAE